jgi:hypothetical protein
MLRSKRDTNHEIRRNIMPPSSVRIDKLGKQQVVFLLIDVCFLDLIFVPEGGGCTFLRNVPLTCTGLHCVIKRISLVLGIPNSWRYRPLRNGSLNCTLQILICISCCSPLYRLRAFMDIRRHKFPP